MGGFQHKSVGTSLTQAEYEQTDTGHQFASQATGMLLYASSSTVNTSLAIGSTSAFLQVVGGVPAWVTAPIVADDTTLKIGNDADSVIVNRSTTLAADAELSNVVEGTSDHLGVAANSLIVSNITNDGDIAFMVSDGGNSIGLLKLNAATPQTQFHGGDVSINAGFGLIVGAQAQETISHDGSTDVVPEVQILGTGVASASLMLAAFSTTATIAGSPLLAFAKGGNATIGSHTVVTDGEELGNIVAYGDDGTDLESIAAQIQFEVDGSPGTGDMPGRIIFSTTADGSETTTERLRISASGEVKVAGTFNLQTVAAAGTDTDKFLVLDSGGNVDYRSGTDTFSDIKVAASASATGVVELATAAEINTSEDTGRAITPDAFAASNYGLRYLQVQAIAPATNNTVADGIAYLHIPAGLNGMDLAEVHVEVQTVATGSTMTFEVSKNGNSTQMLSTNITIDASESGSDSAATAAVIKSDGTEAVATNDVVQINCTQIGSSDPGQGALVTLGFRIP